MVFVEIKRNLIIAQSSLSCQATGRGWRSTFTLSSALSSGISELGKEGRSIPRSRTLPLTLMATEGATVKAVALIAGDPNVKGSLHFFQDATGATHVTGRIAGLSPGLHGFHIHALGDTTNGCISTGPHFNPIKRNHGARTDEDRHAGDLGNIFAGRDGVAEIRLKDMQVKSLNGGRKIPLTGPHSILGRAVVVHADPDDLGRGGHELSKTTGNSGARVGCGVIGLQSAV